MRVIVFGILCAAPAVALPLPHAPGDGVVRVHSSTFVAGWAYDDDGNVVKDPGFVKETATLSGDVGIAPHLTLDASLPLVYLPDRAAPSVGDFDIGGVVDLVAVGPVDISASLDVKVPLYAGVPSVRGRSPVDHLPAVGDGQADVTGAAVFVATLPFDGAMDLYAGYRFRGGDVSDAIVGGGRFGLWFLDRALFTSVVLDTVITLPGSPAETLGAGYAAVGPKVSVRVLDRTFVDVSALWVGRGQNAAGGVDLGVGASTQF